MTLNHGPTTDVAPMRFVDFAVRAWREGPFIQVIAHSTPAGGMRVPVAVRSGPLDPDDYRLVDDAPLARGAEVGRALARFVMPDAVWALLGESLRLIGPDPSLGLRLRLCLDDDLIDLPWEFLYRRDVDAPAAQSGFLLTDGRISLVREPASVVSTADPSDRGQRALFVGTLFDDGSDTWSVEVEFRSLRKAMRPLGALFQLEFARSEDGADVERRLASGCDVFHYAGHTEVELGEGTLVQKARSRPPYYVESLSDRAAWATSSGLAARLGRAGTRLAVFNACNSGFWPVVRPFMRAGIPAVIGVQGLVSNIAALNFAESLYKSLAVGLSLDEALTYARLYVMEPGRSLFDCDWGRFMAYMPTDGAVLFPRRAQKAILARQHAIRTERARTIRDVTALTERLDGAGVSRMLSDIAERSVLILGRFTDERKTVLDAIKRTLATPPREYVPILFDFEKPGDRDLIESIVRYAAVSRFVVADLSDPKCVPAELQAIVPQFPSLPVVPIIASGQREYPVADHILRRASVVTPVVEYRDAAHLVSILDRRVLAPAEARYAELNPAARG
ncbi:MAG: CHAT domain-containing protein [Acidobacteria bacterium]|nr:CHAT domain-containing protein [Acidobacteriota bacterium]